ncbi:Bug family tripartite tricarboxylate transporter substrate binding protein [Plastoroseomonas hellenica]|uniref:Bug family tripartite tricarboxylate transporter substrate binding protein n=1 Tax=Plastoroseomonas hellenica TaxID=2687306 RepID=UPI001BAC2D8D|nr:tripartite tricarboxylate transporter substrate binding protein [Plastoroseomonas hellenica]MBR0641683.1 tripartite tricarboxylate transporter substrate binding protein [Plastoroseomonas hellenica]
MRRWLLALMMAACAGGAAAQTGYPDRPIRVIMPLAAGSAVDVVVRIVADRMSETLGQRLLIENQTGASGMIGMRAGARATPDGYTLLAVNDAVLTMLPNLDPNAGYDPLRDLAPIGQIVRIRWALVAHPSAPAADIAGLIEAARARPGAIDYASGGAGSPQHIAMEMFLRMAGIRMNHISYRGATPALTAVTAGEVPFGFFGLPTPNAFIRSGQLRLLGTAGPARIDTFPDAPTIAEAGVPGYAFFTWGAFLAPGGTPPAAVARLNAALRETLAVPAVRERLEGLGYEVVGNTPDAFAAALARDHAAMGALIRDAGIRVE